MEPWWKIHAFNSVGSTLMFVIAALYGNRIVLAAIAVFWGAANLNSLAAWSIRREMVREGLDPDSIYDEAQDATK